MTRRCWLVRWPRRSLIARGAPAATGVDSVHCGLCCRIAITSRGSRLMNALAGATPRYAFCLTGSPGWCAHTVVDGAPRALVVARRPGGAIAGSRAWLEEVSDAHIVVWVHVEQRREPRLCLTPRLGFQYRRVGEHGAVCGPVVVDAPGYYAGEGPGQALL